MKNKVIVKDRDEWSSLANFIGNIIAKYADEIDFDSLPDPDVYLQKRYIRILQSVHEIPSPKNEIMD